MELDRIIVEFEVFRLIFGDSGFWECRVFIFGG